LAYSLPFFGALLNVVAAIAGQAQGVAGGFPDKGVHSKDKSVHNEASQMLLESFVYLLQLVPN